MTHDPSNAPARLMEMMEGFRVSQCIHVVAALGIPDAIDDEPRSAETIATSLGLHAGAVSRLLRAVASIGVFERRGEGGWAHTPASRLLRKDGPLGDRAVVLGELAWASWGRMDHSVRTGQPAFDAVHGRPFFEHLAADPAVAARFGRVMTAFTRATAEAVIAVHDFSRHRVVVDVGGGLGAMLDVLLSRNPAARAVLLDRPEIIALGAPALGESARGRCELRAGDFFAEVPSGADAYVLSWVLHDWDDEACTRLLRRCAGAMADGAVLLVVEMIVPDDDSFSPAKMFDLEMLVQTGGRERTLAEYRALFEGAGLQLREHLPTASLHSVLVVSR